VRCGEGVGRPTSSKPEIKFGRDISVVFKHCKQRELCQLNTLQIFLYLKLHLIARNTLACDTVVVRTYVVS